MRDIKVDVTKEKGAFSRMPNFCVGAGRAEEALRKGFYDQLKLAHDKCGFKYLRFHGLFCDEMASCLQLRRGEWKYNWQYIDDVFDMMLDIGIRPFVELSFMPEALASGKQTVFWWKGNVTPPNDYQKYHDFIKAFTLHCEERYGRDEVLTWFFEVWNEPDLRVFFSENEDINEYFKIYDAAATAVKEVCEAYRVGGPATSEHHWVREMIAHCVENKIPIDFVSTHTYGVEGAVDEFGVNMHIMLDDIDYIPKGVAGVRRQINESPLSELPRYYTEWSSSYTPRDNVHDSYINAPYVLYNMKRLEGSVDAMSYWTFTDIFEESGPAPTPFHGGFGLINYQGIKKPTFYAYEFMHELGGTELVNSDSDSWVCRDGDCVQALVWNYTKPQQNGLPNQHFYIQDLKPGMAEPAKLSLTGLAKGDYLVSIRRVGYQKSDAYAEYLKLGRPENLNRGQVRAIIECTDCQPEKQLVRLDGEFCRELPLEENEIYFIELEKLK